MHIRPFFHDAITKICLFALSIASALCQSPGNEIEDSAQSGSYLIVYCNATATGSHTAYLQTLIPYMQSNLHAVLNDLDRGIASPAYSAFFKTNNNLDAVRQVFTDIINGSPVLSVDPQNVTRWSPPTLVCADADQPSLHHLLGNCNTPGRPVMNVLQPARIASICPIFWTLPRIARHAACPFVVDGNLLTEPWNLRTTHYAVLVHELVHIYNRFDNRNEVYDLQDVVDLNALRSLENAQNFASYAAGECGSVSASRSCSGMSKSGSEKLMCLLL